MIFRIKMFDKKFFILFQIFILSLFLQLRADNLNLIKDIKIFNEDGSINVVVEIPAGTIEKWEVQKNGGHLEKEIESGKFRKVDYLPYPFNYGFIPQTMLPLNKGGDGDQLDVVIIGPSISRGSIIKVKPIGAIILNDKGQVDTKIISLSINDTNLAKMNSIADIKKNYLGLFDIISLWLQNYKGEVLELKGFLSKKNSLNYINQFHQEYLAKE